MSHAKAASAESSGSCAGTFAAQRVEERGSPRQQDHDVDGVRRAAAAEVQPLRCVEPVLERHNGFEDVGPIGICR